MKDKILEAFKKLPDKHAYLKQITGNYETNPDLWVKENILQSPEPVQKAFYKQLTEDYEQIAAKIKANKIKKDWEIACIRIEDECKKALNLTDWTQLPDAPITQQEKREYREYRKWLRNKYKRIKDKLDTNYNVFKFKEWKKIYTK